MLFKDLNTSSEIRVIFSTVSTMAVTHSPWIFTAYFPSRYILAETVSTRFIESSCFRSHTSFISPAFPWCVCPVSCSYMAYSPKITYVILALTLPAYQYLRQSMESWGPPFAPYISPISTVSSNLQYNTLLLTSLLLILLTLFDKSDSYRFFFLELRWHSVGSHEILRWCHTILCSYFNLLIWKYLDMWLDEGLWPRRRTVELEQSIPTILRLNRTILLIIDCDDLSLRAYVYTR